MTKREAVKGLDRLKTIIRKESNMQIALDMAIEALEQEETLQNLTKPNKSDLISRQAAIEALYDKGLSMTAWGELLAMKWSDIQTCIELLPSAQPFTEEQIQTMQELESAQLEKAYELGKADRPKWIPVSKKLPDTYDDMLVTDGESMAVGSYRDDADAWDNYNFGWLENLSEPPHGIKTVIAWMPLPEIYREDGEEE